MANIIHHIELWTRDLDRTGTEFRQLLEFLGWRTDDQPQWEEGMTFHEPDGAYIVLEQSPAITGPHDRMRAGLNHLALRVASRAVLDDVRTRASSWGWSELFADSYPHAGGPDYTALYLESSEGFEMELVCDPPA